MSYARDGASIKKNQEAYAKYRSKVKYGTTQFEADNGANADLRSGTTDKSGQRIGGFDQAGYSLGSNADEINYRINKNGSFSMKDLNDLNTFGGRADKDGILKRKNASDLKVSGGKNGGAWRTIDDMANNNTGDQTYKFDQDVLDHVASKRKQADAVKAQETNRKEAKERAKMAKFNKQREAAHSKGEAYGSVEEAAAKRKADDDRAASMGDAEVKQLQESRQSEEQERKALDDLVQKRKSGAKLSCAERRKLNMNVSDCSDSETDQANASKPQQSNTDQTQQFNTSQTGQSATDKSKQSNATDRAQQYKSRFSAKRSSSTARQGSNKQKSFNRFSSKNNGSFDRFTNKNKGSFNRFSNKNNGSFTNT